MNGFWTDGCDAYLEVLEKEFKERTGAIKEKLKQASTAEEVKAIERQIRQEHEDYKRRVAQTDKCLF